MYVAVPFAKFPTVSLDVKLNSHVNYRQRGSAEFCVNETTSPVILCLRMPAPFAVRILWLQRSNVSHRKGLQNTLSLCTVLYLLRDRVHITGADLFNDALALLNASTSSIEDVPGTQKSSFRRLGLTYAFLNKPAVCGQIKHFGRENILIFFLPAGCREAPDCRTTCKIVG